MHRPFQIKFDFDSLGTISMSLAWLKFQKCNFKTLSVAETNLQKDYKRHIAVKTFFQNFITILSINGGTEKNWVYSLEIDYKINMTSISNRSWENKVSKGKSNVWNYKVAPQLKKRAKFAQLLSCWVIWMRYNVIIFICIAEFM